ncbi:ribosome silencing factor [Rhodoferax sediminis]|uniref:Ribosomal silencing factor RsfS n=1 Tax=Rhodoferax sediminis TaxID=2509614 RepID=A0A515DBD9_9BURK|nr:ribosome silencing factor [Rhodoferax sediminis]QDL37709.1 ribosome silencing factor [Rhodoferax sediminis]
MTTETNAKKDTQKLQRAIVDGLEDVKAQDLQVFNTEHLSALFERVIIASGSSNRQTKALASSVRDAVRDAGFPKPRMEGEANGEWIIVDCGRAVVHVMQPTIRAYYNLEEIWGGTPVRLKFGAARPEVAPAAKSAAKPAAKAGARKPAAKKTESKVAPAPAKSAKHAAKIVEKVETSPSLRRSSAVKTAARAAKTAAKTPARVPVKAPTKTALRSRAKPAAKKAPARKA